jgi:2-desacetyl-2-hydroxyethyl bacteriochlorophyllide A dehydrogenase
MQALWLENRQIRLRSDVPKPLPGPGEALVRVRLAGVCATDLALTRGYLPFRGVPGHELVGVIAAAPDAPGRVGERVVGEINLGCGVCFACRAGRRRHCERREALGIRGRDGAFAEYLTLPLANLHALIDALPDEVAVFSEPLAAALRVRAQRPVLPRERVLLVGAGRLGQLVARTLALTGCRLEVVARHARQRELLAAAGIAWIGEEDPGEQAYDLVVEASGSPAGFALARRAVRPGGTLALKSTYPEEVSLDLSALVVDEVTLLGSRCGDLESALELLRLGRLDPRPLIDARYPLSEAPAALAHAARPGALKILVDCES